MIDFKPLLIIHFQKQNTHFYAFKLKRGSACVYIKK